MKTGDWLLMLVVAMVMMMMSSAAPRKYYSKPRNCQDIYINGHTESGVYKIHVGHFNAEVKVYCHMTDDGVGWTVILRRKDGSENFDRGWLDYKEGFGSLTGEFWIGLRWLHYMTMNAPMKMRVTLGDFRNKTAFMEYSHFRISNQKNGFRITMLGLPTGIAGDSLMYSVNQQFNTKDKPDTDTWSTGQCAKKYKCGWWFNKCSEALLTGVYRNTSQLAKGQSGIEWQSWHEAYSMKFAEMKLTPNYF